MTEQEKNGSVKLVIPSVTPGDYSGFASVVSEWTYFYQSQMWPRTSEKILSYFQKGQSVLLIDGQTNQLYAHAAIKWISNLNPVLEIGTVVANPEFKGQGWGLKAVSLVIKLAKEKYPGYQFFAFCNFESLGLFKKLGWIEAEKSDLPDEVWEGCNKCPNKNKALAAGKLCCDTVVILPKPGIANY
jgi:N-acetylglutamate synthase-like GNAT family acetyltransferase